MIDVRRIGIVKRGTITLQSLLNAVRDNPEIKRGGAIVTFTGIVRGYTHKEEAVRKLEVEASDEEANKAIARISNELRAKPGIIDVLICHFVGEFNVGDDLVYVIVVGKSRKESFEALEEAVERYKKEVAIWKKEYLENGSSYWVSE